LGKIPEILAHSSLPLEINDIEKLWCLPAANTCTVEKSERLQ